MAKILPILLFLTFVAYGQNSREDVLRMFGKYHAKCCCSKDAVGDKVCENILLNAIEPEPEDLERYQEDVKSFGGIQLLCAVIASRFACGNMCGFLECPGQKRDCSVDTSDFLEDD